MSASAYKVSVGVTEHPVKSKETRLPTHTDTDRTKMATSIILNTRSIN